MSMACAWHAYGTRPLQEEVESIMRAIGGSDDTFKVRGSAATRQVVATYSCESSALQIALALPPSHPLRAVEVGCRATHAAHRSQPALGARGATDAAAIARVRGRSTACSGWA